MGVFNWLLQRIAMSERTAIRGRGAVYLHRCRHLLMDLHWTRTGNTGLDSSKVHAGSLCVIMCSIYWRPLYLPPLPGWGANGVFIEGFVWGGTQVPLRGNQRCCLG